MDQELQQNNVVCFFAGLRSESRSAHRRSCELLPQRQQEKGGFYSRETSHHKDFSTLIGRLYALDYFRDSYRTLAAWAFRPCCGGFYPSASRDRCDCSGHQVSAGQSAVMSKLHARAGKRLEGGWLFRDVRVQMLGHRHNAFRSPFHFVDDMVNPTLLISCLLLFFLGCLQLIAHSRNQGSNSSNRLLEIGVKNTSRRLFNFSYPARSPFSRNG